MRPTSTLAVPTQKACNIPTAPGFSVDRRTPLLPKTSVPSRPPLRDVRNAQRVHLARRDPGANVRLQPSGRPKESTTLSCPHTSRAEVAFVRCVPTPMSIPVPTSATPAPSSLLRVARSSHPSTSSGAGLPTRKFVRETAHITHARTQACHGPISTPPTAITSSPIYGRKQVSSDWSLSGLKLESLAPPKQGFCNASDRLAESCVLLHDAFQRDLEDVHSDDEALDSLFLSTVRSNLSGVSCLPGMPLIKHAPAACPIIRQTLPQPEGSVADATRMSRFSIPAFGAIEEEDEPEGLWYYFLSKDSITEFNTAPTSQSISSVAPTLASPDLVARLASELWEISSDEGEDETDGGEEAPPTVVHPLPSTRPTSIAVPGSYKPIGVLAPNNKPKAERSSLYVDRGPSSRDTKKSSTKQDVMTSFTRLADAVKTKSVPSPSRHATQKKVEMLRETTKASPKIAMRSMRHLSHISVSRIPGYRQYKATGPSPSIGRKERNPSQHAPRNRSMAAPRLKAGLRSPSGYNPTIKRYCQGPANEHPIVPRRRPPVHKGAQPAKSSTSCPLVYSAPSRGIMMMTPVLAVPHPSLWMMQSSCVDPKKRRRNGALLGNREVRL